MCSVVQCVAVCCSALQCVAVRCSVLQHVHYIWSTQIHLNVIFFLSHYRTDVPLCVTVTVLPVEYRNSQNSAWWCLLNLVRLASVSWLTFQKKYLYSLSCSRQQFGHLYTSILHGVSGRSYSHTHSHSNTHTHTLSHTHTHTHTHTNTHTHTHRRV